MCTHLRSELLSLVGGYLLMMTIMLNSLRVIRKGRRCDMKDHWWWVDEDYLFLN